jgi:hypothetical protein
VLGFSEVAVLTPSTNIMVEGALEKMKKDNLKSYTEISDKAQ